MQERTMTDQEKDVLKQIALLADPACRWGLTIWYNPEIPAERAACYMVGLAAPNKTWENEVNCTKEQLDGIRDFADFLESQDALRCMKRKAKDNGEYYVVYEVCVPGFDSVYKRIDPEGYEKALQIIKNEM
ncbi:hypothetical protein [Pontiella sulfatireligans]|uniref:Uncharacterized protein n=1 Tax=Pontiella sulfatireligans TaxID=2750658 RepID=A0A6C2US09_9BACT|nr:hypothetical protein [Pontiella sulfatireligans]VGO22044.1 hypothetical protein SCARR_04125 [Pontiella sulfatireligans]